MDLWKRWSENGIFVRMMVELASGQREGKTEMIDTTYLKAHRKATSMGVKKGELVENSFFNKLKTV